MIALLQRVTSASCTVEGNIVGSVGKGLLLFVCAEKNDLQKDAVQLAQKVLKYRVFSDPEGKMNLSALDTNAEILCISQFTLSADTNSGNRPSFSPAASPEKGKELYEVFVSELKRSNLKVDTGIFGAHMEIALVNDGPVTFWLKIPKS